MYEYIWNDWDCRTQMCVSEWETTTLGCSAGSWKWLLLFPDYFLPLSLNHQHGHEETALQKNKTDKCILLFDVFGITLYKVFLSTMYICQINKFLVHIVFILYCEQNTFAATKTWFRLRTLLSDSCCYIPVKENWICDTKDQLILNVFVICLKYTGYLVFWFWALFWCNSCTSKGLETF